MTAYPLYNEVCPRGFANEFVIFKIKSEQEAAEFSAEYGNLENTGGGGYANTNISPAGHWNKVVDWADRHWM